MTSRTDTGNGVWQAQYAWVTVGAVALIFLAAMQSLAVTTVMVLRRPRG